jgi:AraC-like DNA-binding protein
MAVRTGHEVFSSPALRMGVFRCPIVQPDFETAGQIDTYHVCFPRSAVWLEYEDQPRFVADASRATLYNPWQPFRRAPISPDGDVTDWMALSDSLARDIVTHFSPADAEADGAFRFRASTVCQATYLAQRALFNDIEAGLDDRLAIEERAIGIIGRVIGNAYIASRGTAPTRPRAQQLVESAREAILVSLFDNQGVSDIAAHLGVSVFHLCRVFRATTGLTLHAYRRDMRLRVALDLIPGHRGQLSSLALQVGFNSHAHFTAAFRKAFGVTPSIASAIT